MWDIDELCKYLKCGRNAVYSNVKKGNLPAPLKIGKYSRWHKEEVDEWIEKNNKKGKK